MSIFSSAFDWMSGAAGDAANWAGDALGGIGEAGRDMFSSQDARTDLVKPEDYLYGGSEQARDAQLKKLEESGDFGLGQMRTTGDQAWSSMNTAQLGIQDASKGALEAGQAQSGTAQGYADTASRAFATAPSTYGDDRTQGAWSRSIGNLRDFAPSSTVSGIGSKLAGYDAGSVDSRLGDSYAALQGYAAQGPGPSAAEAQLGAALDRNVAAQAALAKSGRGAGANTNAMRQAMFSAADQGQRAATDLATLRASEAATWRGQQLQALGAAGGLAGNLESAAQGRQGIGLQGLTSGAGILSNQDAMTLNASQAAANQYGNMYGAQVGAQQAATAGRQGYLGQAIGAQSNAAGQSAGAYDDYLSGLGTAANITTQAGQTRLNALQGGLANKAAYDQAGVGVQENEAQRRSSLAQAYMHEQSANSRSNQQADLEKDAAGAGMLGGAISMLGGLF